MTKQTHSDRQQNGKSKGKSIKTSTIFLDIVLFCVLLIAINNWFFTDKTEPVQAHPLVNITQHDEQLTPLYRDFYNSNEKQSVFSVTLHDKSIKSRTISAPTSVSITTTPVDKSFYSLYKYEFNRQTDCNLAQQQYASNPSRYAPPFSVHSSEVFSPTVINYGFDCRRSHTMSITVKSDRDSFLSNYIISPS